MTQPQAEQIERAVRRHSEGVLAFDDRTSPVRFVVCWRTGGLVMPVEPPVLTAEEVVLFTPDLGEQSCQVLLDLRRLSRDDEAGGARDQWLAYHVTEPVGWVWVMAEATCARLEGAVAEGQACCRPNPLRAAMGRLCRELNADVASLRSACERIGGQAVADPLAVGVDPLGIDVRARFGIVRIDFPHPADTEDDALGEIRRTLRGETPA